MVNERKRDTRETRRTSRTAHRKATRTAKRAWSHRARTARFENDAVFSHVAFVSDCELFDAPIVNYCGLAFESAAAFNRGNP